MADVGIKITAQDDTAGAFASAQRNMAGLKAEAEGLQNSVTTALGKFGSIALVVGAAFETASLKSIIDMGDKLDDLSEKTGISAKELSEWRYASEVAGTSLEGLTNGITKLTRNMSAAAGGNKEAAETFKAMGLSLKGSDGALKDTNVMLGELADKFSSYKDGPEKAALAMKVFGKAGQDMIPILNKGAQGIAELRDEATKLGAVYGDDMAKAAGDFNDNLKRITLSGEAIKIKIAGELLPTLNTLSEAFISSKNGSLSLAEALGGGLKNVLQTATVVGMEIAFVFKGVGREIGGILAQFDAMANRKSFFDFSGVQAVRQAMLEDAAAARMAQEAATKRVLGISDKFVDPRILGEVGSIEAQTKAMRDLAPTVTDVANAAKEAASAYDSLNLAMTQRLASMEAEMSLGRKLTESEKFDSEMRTKLADATTKLTDKEREKLKLKLDEVTARAKVAEAQARETKAAQDAFAQSEAAKDETLKALKEEKDARDRIYIATAQNTLAAEDAMDLAQLEAKSVFMQAEDRKRLLDYYRIELDLRNKIKAINSSAGLDNEKRAELIAIEEGNAARLKGVADMNAGTARTSSILESINSTAQRVWTDVTTGGQDAFKRIGQTLKAAVLDLLYQMTIKKWIISIGASVTGASVANASGGASALSTANSVYSAYNSGSSLYGVGSAYLSGSMSGANAAGSIFANATGTGIDGLLATNGAYGTALTATGEAMTGAATAAEGLTAALGSIPVYGWVALAALAAYAVFSGDGPKPSLEGGFATAGGPTGSANGRDFVGGVYGGLIDSSAKKVVDDLQTSYSATVKALGAKAGELTAQSFIGMNQGDNGNPNALHLDAQLNGQWLYNRWTDNGGSLDAGKTTAEMEAAVALSTKKIVLEALKATDLGTSLNDYLDTVVTQGKSLEEINATLGDIGSFVQFRDAVKALPFEYLTQASVAAEKAIVAAAGGIEGFQSALGNYVDKFYSDTDKTAFATKALSNSFAALGVTMPAIDKTTRDWYKSEVAAAGAKDLSIKANSDAYVSILNLASAVDTLAPAAESAADKLRTTVLDNLKGTTSSISTILKDGMLGKISKDDVGGQVADAIANGLQDAMAQTVADQIASAFTANIITPIIDAVLQGAAISSAVSQATIDGAVASAKQSMDAIAALFNDAGFQSLLGSIRTSLGGSTSASINSGAAQGNNGANFGGSATQGSPAATVTAALTYAQQHAAIEAANAYAKQYPIAATGSAGQIVYREQQAFHLSAQDAASQLQSLQTALESLSASTQTETERRAAERYVVDDANLALYDRVQLLKDEAAANALAKDALTNKQSWQDKLDVLTGKTTDVALQQAKEIAAVEAHAAEARAQLVYVTDAAARAALEQAIATDEATKAIIGQVYAQQQAAQAAAAAAQAAAARSGWQDKIDVLMGAKTDRSVQMARELAGTTDETTKALIRQYYAQLDLADASAAATAAAQAAQSAAATATDAALAGVQRAVEAQRTVAQAQLQVAQESVNNLTSVFDTLKGAVADLYGQVGSTSSMSAISARTMIESALTTGYLPTKGELSDALSAINKGITGTAYASKFEADRDRLTVAGKLDKLRTISGDQLSAAEQAAQAAQDQLDSLDAILANAQAQADALRGVDTSVKSVEAAIAALSSAILAERAATVSAAVGAGAGAAGTAVGGASTGAGATVQGLYQSLLGRQADTAGLQYWTSQITTGAVSAANLMQQFAAGAAGAGEVTAAVKQVLHDAGVPGYAVGTPYVPQDGLAYLHEGEAVIPAKFNPFSGAPSAGRDEALVGEIRGLREENQAQARAMVQMQARLTKLMERWDGSGMPSTRIEV